MKKSLILPTLALLALLAAGCGKQHNCECIVEDVEVIHNPVMVVDNGMKCSDITEMAIEEKYVTDDGTHSLQRTEVHKVSCHEQRH